ncbi:MAG TPA: FecR domain-containing protein [Candidatus Eisenbacteria bacterium]|jgi:hypothetical protein|nr:FecR domain-containing protein [Candidatus Eisenbacteria bacterium]
MKSVRFASLFVLAASLSFLSASGFAEGTVQILSAEGRVQAKDSPSSEWKDAAVGTTLSAGAEVRTDASSSCELGFLRDQKSAVRVKPGSDLSIESVGPVRLNLRSGRIYSLIRELKPGASFTIKTPTAVAAARGTGGEHGVDDIVVHDGTFEVSTPNGDVKPVSEGEGVFFKDDGFGEKFQADAASSAEWKDFQTDASQDLEKASGEKEKEKEPEKEPAGETTGGTGGGTTDSGGGDGPKEETQTSFDKLRVDTDSSQIEPVDDKFAETGSPGIQDMEKIVTHETTVQQDDLTQQTKTTDPFVDQSVKPELQSDSKDIGTHQLGGGTDSSTGGSTDGGVGSYSTT